MKLMLSGSFNEIWLEGTYAQVLQRACNNSYTTEENSFVYRREINVISCFLQGRAALFNWTVHWWGRKGLFGQEIVSEWMITFALIQAFLPASKLSLDYNSEGLQLLGHI